MIMNIINKIMNNNDDNNKYTMMNIMSSIALPVASYYIWIIIIDRSYKRDGRVSNSFQRLKIWKSGYYTIIIIITLYIIIIFISM